ncbi:hypothetical protein KFE98_16265 [bacterium SCSIO 12741]|nr:hypothetical protein KFE98_16265 [bacterium SCSIO 12741]
MDLSLTVTREEVLLCVYDLFAFRSLFRSSKDGLTAELVSFDNQYSCDEAYEPKPNTRNGKSIVDGMLLPPIYRNNIEKQVMELYEKARKRPKTKGEKTCHYLRLGATPEGMSDFPLEAKLHFINNKVLCSELNFYSYCGSLPNVEAPKLELVLDLRSDGVRPNRKTTTVHAEVEFPKGKVDFDTDQLSAIVGFMKNQEVKVQSVYLQAFASVEGSASENEQLFTGRAKSLVKYLQGFQSDSISYEVKSQENWDLFYKQLEGSDFLHLKRKSKEEIKKWLRVEENRLAVEHLLAEQRKALVTIRVKPVESDLWDWMLLRDEWLDKVQRKELKQVDRLRQVQRYLIRNRNHVPAELRLAFDTLLPPQGEGWEYFWYTQSIYRQQYGIGGPSATLANKLKDMNPILVSKEADYNLKVLLSRDLEILEAPDRIALAQSLINEGKGWLPDSVQQKLDVWFHLEMARLVFLSQDEEDLTKADPSLDYLEMNYLQIDSSDSRRLDLASMMLAFGRVNQADSLIQPLVEADEPNLQALRLYLTAIAPVLYEHREPALASLLLESYEKLGPKNWCRLFIGKCKIPLHVLDQPGLRSLYCESCSGMINSQPD